MNWGLFAIILLLLIIGYLLYPIVKIIYRIVKIKKQFENQFNRQQAQYEETVNPSNFSRREKIFDDSMGEYVEFEELSSDEIENKPRMEKFPFPDIESRIEDAEWEEI